jgi:hypothetical protein
MQNAQTFRKADSRRTNDDEEQRRRLWQKSSGVPATWIDPSDEALAALGHEQGTTSEGRKTSARRRQAVLPEDRAEDEQRTRTGAS